MLSWRREIIEKYDMTDDEIYGDRPQYRRCEGCELIVHDDDLENSSSWWRLCLTKECNECRRDHLKRLLEKWRTRGQEKIA